MVEAPADILDKAKKLAISIAQKAVGSLEGAGVFAVELFLTQDGKVCSRKVHSILKISIPTFGTRILRFNRLRATSIRPIMANLITVVFYHIYNGSFSMVDCDHT